MSAAKVLIIDDDRHLAEIASRQLEELGYLVTHVEDGRSGLAKALESEFNLVVVDLGLPRLGGMEVCRQLRAQRPALPIIVLTGRSDETSTVLALELGADEFIAKPIKPLEFKARVRALMRRAELPNTAGSFQSIDAATPSVYQFRDISIDDEKRMVTVEGNQIPLTVLEYDLLKIFVEFRGRALSKENIVEHLWGDTAYVYSENVRTIVSRLRVKLEAVGKKPPYIVTQRGFGYRSATEDE
jgi:two-component system alkaline phosphatase synthesis response regulator PhoP